MLLKLPELVVRVTVQIPSKGKGTLILIFSIRSGRAWLIWIHDTVDCNLNVIHEWRKSLNQCRVSCVVQRFHMRKNVLGRSPLQREERDS